MKVTKKMTLMRRYYTSLVVFLLALGIVPVSLATSSSASGTKTQSTESISEPFKLDENLKLGKIDIVPETTPIAVVKPKVETVKAEDEVAEPKTEMSEPKVEVADSETKEVEAYETPVYETPVYETVYTYTYEEPVTVYDQINIAGNTVPIFYSDNTLIDAGSQAGLYGSHFIYGHNTANVFGGLANLSIGSRFTVTLSGVTKTYQIVNSDLQTKTHFEGETIHRSKLDGVTVLTKMKIMKAITAYGEYNGKYYDYILMTCAGTSYGNGDASHRLILMANEV